jgi:N6-adenosine-specific RNA methylase IME4
MSMEAMALIKVDKEFKRMIPPLSNEERAGLETSIAKEGCRVPIDVWDGVIVDGHNRYEICAQNQITYEVNEVQFANRDAARVWIIDNQLSRRNLPLFSQAELRILKEGFLKAKAKENQRQAGGANPVPQNSGKAVDTDKEIAKDAGTSHDTIHRTRVIMEKADDETKDKLRTGEESINSAYKQIKKDEKAARKAEKIEELINEISPLPLGPFRVIVADPPWDDTARKNDATHRGVCPYPSQTTDEIKAMEVNELAHDDAILWLWTTNAFMRQAYDVAEFWGFQVKTILTWAKDRMGLGDWLRGQTEHCLMCVRGKPVVNLTNETTIIHGPMREHSRKPDEFYAMVEKLCPGSKFEMYSRQEREGWQSHGNEPSKF